VVAARRLVAKKSFSILIVTLNLTILPTINNNTQIIQTNAWVKTRGRTIEFHHEKLARQVVDLVRDRRFATSQARPFGFVARRRTSESTAHGQKIIAQLTLDHD